MKPITGTLVALAVGSLAVSCAKVPMPLEGYFPLAKNKVLKLVQPREVEPGEKRKMLYEVTAYQRVGDGYLATYQYTQYFGKAHPIITTYDLQVGPDSVQVARQSTEMEGKTYPDEGGRVLLAMPGPEDKAAVDYDWAKTKITFHVYRGEAVNTSKTYPDCAVFDETMHDPETYIRTRTYYQRGIGIVREEYLKADGTVDGDMVYELAE